jgi:hypothetical protein
MSPRALLLILASCASTSAVLAGDAVKAKELMTLMRADEVVAGAMKSSLRIRKDEVGLTDAQLACVNAVRPAEFSDAVTAALAQGLSDAELAAAIAFYRTPAGARYVKSLVPIMQGAGQAEALTDEDAARVHEFASTPTGTRLLKQALIPNSNVVADRMAQVSADAVENCGKPAAR